jgi:hypothetical protein
MTSLRLAQLDHVSFPEMSLAAMTENLAPASPVFCQSESDLRPAVDAFYLPEPKGRAQSEYSN